MPLAHLAAKCTPYSSTRSTGQTWPVPWLEGVTLHAPLVNGEKVTAPQVNSVLTRQRNHGGEAYWPAWGMKELGDESASWEEEQCVQRPGGIH